MKKNYVLSLFLFEKEDELKLIKKKILKKSVLYKKLNFIDSL